MLPNHEYTGGGAGWRCASCGAWVPSGVGHICGNQNPYYGQSAYYSAFISPDTLERIAKALERIADSLSDNNRSDSEERKDE